MPGVKPYRREEPRATMTHTTTDEKVDAGLAQAEYDARIEAEEIADAGGPDVMPLVDAIQMFLFHPQLTPNEKILTMQLIWIGEPMTAADLGKGTGLTSLAIQYALKRMMALGIVETRFRLDDTKTGQTTRIFELLAKNARKVGDIKAPEPTTADDPAASDEPSEA